MSRILLSRRFLSTRLYYSSQSSIPKPASSSRRSAPAVKISSKRHNLPQIRTSHEAKPTALDHDPRRKFEPFPFAVTEDNKVDLLKKMITPLCDTPYEEQLAAKETYCRNAFRLIAQQLYRSGTPVRMDVKRLPCEVSTIVASPQIHKYRNTDELSLWYGHDGKTITAGYNIFSISKHGDTVTVEPNGNPVMREETIKLCDIIQEFLRTQTKIISFSLGQQGGWRSFRIASSLKGELMLTGYLNPRTLKVREVIDDRDNFRDFMVRRCKEENLKLVSLYYQPCPHSICRHEDIPYELLHGEKRLTEQIGRYKFFISPDSYNHQSSIGAEILFETVIKTINECFLDTRYRDSASSKPIILDARSNSGMMSIHLSEIAKQVIGVEDRALLVEDARASAELNGVKNCEFINSNLEIVLERLIEKYCKRGQKEMLVVCDMKPGGLHASVIDVIRECISIKKLVLVTSRISGTGIQESIIKLCSKGKANSLPPFAPVRATPVDVCPMTEMFYTVLALERVPQ